MRSKFVSMIKNSLIYLSVFTIITTFTLSYLPTKSFAESSTEKNYDTIFEVLEFIKSTDEEMIYKTLENGEVFLYKELINNDIVTTKKYKIEGNNENLIENFVTINEVKGDTISVTQNDLMHNELISKSTVEILPIKEIEDNEIKDEISILATGKWVKARGAGNNYQYYKYNNGGGKARELSREKTLNSYNKYFDQFTRNVDSLRSFEIGVLKDLLFIGVIDQAFKSIKNPTVANITKFLKKYLKSIPGVSVIVSMVQYLNLSTKTMYSYEDIPGSEKRWK